MYTRSPSPNIDPIQPIPTHRLCVPQPHYNPITTPLQPPYNPITYPLQILRPAQTLSSLEIGDIYLSSIKMAEGGGNIRKLTFLEFWEATVRCALVAYVEIGFWERRNIGVDCK